jgi:hypothetical protein
MSRGRRVSLLGTSRRRGSGGRPVVSFKDELNDDEAHTRLAHELHKLLVEKAVEEARRAKRLDRGVAPVCVLCSSTEDL